MQMPRTRRSLVVILGFAAFLLACYPESLIPQETISVVPTAPKISTRPTEAPSPTVPATLVPVATPQDTQAAMEEVTSALQVGDASALSHLLLDQVWLAQGPNGDQGQAMPREAVTKWLNARWGRRRAVVSSDFVQHVVLLAIETSGWVPLAPVQAGIITFNLHRYNAQGQADPLQGNWRIDTILYQ